MRDTPKTIFWGGFPGQKRGLPFGGIRNPEFAIPETPPPLPANLPLEQDTPKTPGLEHPQRYSSGGPVTLIIRVPGTPKRGGGFDPQNGGKNSLWGHSGCAWGTPKREVFGVGGCFWGIFWGGGPKTPIFPSSGPPKCDFRPPETLPSINPTQKIACQIARSIITQHSKLAIDFC